MNMNQDSYLYRKVTRRNFRAEHLREAEKNLQQIESRYSENVYAKYRTRVLLMSFRRVKLYRIFLRETTHRGM